VPGHLWTPNVQWAFVTIEDRGTLFDETVAILNRISKIVLLHSKTLSIIHRTAAEKVVILFYIERKSSIKRMF
jgi:hypothetical protein